MASWKLGRTTWVKAHGPLWLRSRRIASGSTLIKSSSDPETPTCRMPVSQAARLIPQPPAWRYTTPAPTSLPQLADLATNDNRSPLYGAGNAGVIARGSRLFRRDDESRSESYADILGRAGRAMIEGEGKSATDQAAQSNYAMHAHGAVSARSRSIPILGRCASPESLAPSPRDGSSILVWCIASFAAE